MTTIISFIIVIGIIVFFHEFGHFIAAKLSGVRVEIFSLGFPPKMIGRKIGETEYQIAWIPLGGFVKMSGMLDESFDDDFDADDPRVFINQSFARRVFIITAGVLMNFILAFLIYSVLTATQGIPTMSSAGIDIVESGSPAESVGIMSGDQIVEIAGKEINEWMELTQTIQQHPAEPIGIKWLRDDSLYSAVITPAVRPSLNLDTGTRDSVGYIGVSGIIEMNPVSPLLAVGYGAVQVIGVLHLNVISLKWLITGKAKIKELSGPLGIAKMSGDSVRGGITSFISFIAFISVSIGFLNILPIPMLDGGHLLFMIIEGIIGRPIPEKIKINLMKVGLAALLLLIIVVSYHDIIRFYLTKD